MLRPISRLALLVAFLLLFHQPSNARTWRVTLDGTGDAPFLQAAMDSAVAGDTVLVAPGEYVIGSLRLTNGIVFMSEQGPRQTRFVEYPDPGINSGLACGGHSARATVVSGFWFDSFVQGASEGLGAINAVDSSPLIVRGCVFTNNNVAGIAVAGGFLRLENNTFANNVQALDSEGTTIASCWRNIFWDPAPGVQLMSLTCNDFLRIADSGDWSDLNFSADPQFCAPGDYRIATASPCAPGNSPLGTTCNELIGAYSPECPPPTPVESRSWGAIKALYRKPH